MGAWVALQDRRKAHPGDGARSRRPGPSSAPELEAQLSPADLAGRSLCTQGAPPSSLEVPCDCTEHLQEENSFSAACLPQKPLHGVRGEQTSVFCFCPEQTPRPPAPSDSLPVRACERAEGRGLSSVSLWDSMVPPRTEAWSFSRGRPADGGLGSIAHGLASSPRLSQVTVPHSGLGRGLLGSAPCLSAI